MDIHTTYSRHADQPYGKRYAATVHRFQQSFMDDLGLNLDAAFERAVNTTERLIEVIKIQEESI